MSAPFNLTAHCVAAAAKATPDKIALLDAATGKALTYRALETLILRAAFLLRSKVTQKDSMPAVVLVRLGNTPSYPLAFFGAIAAGLVPVPVSPDLTRREMGVLIEECEPSAVVLDDTLPTPDLAPEVTLITAQALEAALAEGETADYAWTAPEDPAFMVFTSGTTARPKGVVHAHRTILGRRPMYRHWYAITPTDRVLHAGSFNWTYTLGTGLMDVWANGATSVIYSGTKTPDLWPRLIAEHQVSLFATVPGLYRQILKYAGEAAERMPTLRHGLSAGEALPDALREQWRARTGTQLYQALGQSEISTYISTCPEVPPKLGTVGKPQTGRCVVILDEDSEDPMILPAGAPGLIAVHRSDPGLMLGYWRRPEEQAQMFRGEWFVGGDAGVVDADGYIAHLGRRNELLNAGGFRVSPLEVEAELAGFAGVAEVAVAETAIKEGVSIITAFIVPQPDASLNAEAIKAFAATRLAAYKQPKRIVFVDALPKTPNGKVRRAELGRGLSLA